jgi:hypothetical protein
MAGRVPQRPAYVDVLSVQKHDDPVIGRMAGQIEQAVQQVQQARSRVVVTADLAIGTNRVRHGLGRPVVGYTLTPTAASAAFAHAINTANTNPELEVWIDVIGAAQPGARLEVW